MTVALDLTNRHWTYVRGQITVIGTWYSDGSRHRPCMVLVRTFDPPELMVPCVITLDKAWIWSREVGDEVQAAEIMAGFLVSLRMEPDTKTIVKLFGIVEDYLGDLISMPPYMAPLSEIIAEVTVTDRATGKSREVALRDV